MEISIPENPNSYLMILGITGVILFALDFKGFGANFVNLIVLSLATIFFSVGYFGLKRERDLRVRKLEKEIELLDKKINSQHF